ncbi:hypothetical protein E8E12_007027 [Didymella heteroderae]|uniref:Heterokaryon incompatibility domain-containing protein n=1 Tax=Didymella heteroderae TaxID=1769908 RepID=A0A9P4WMC3_9PLEO|nr:hypothetical protein E8E12_007027 [Didymella heteroderae]
MSDIYSNSYLTIAASKARSATETLFVPGQIEQGQTHWFRSSDNQMYAIHTREPEPHLYDFGGYAWQTETQAYRRTHRKTPLPLLRRAWAFQERYLSPRVVHFGPAELLWECAEDKCCECSNAKYPEDRKRLHVSGNTKPTYMYTSAQIWMDLIEQYTEKELTYPSDIFPGIQGVAKAMDRAGNYHAGIWDDDDVLQQLVWRAAKPGRPEKWRAPSWSWASVRGPVRYLLRSSHMGWKPKQMASLVSISTSPVGLDPLGEVRSGRLQLKGPCVDMQLDHRGLSREFPHKQVWTWPRQGVPSWHTRWSPDYDLSPFYGRTVKMMDIIHWPNDHVDDRRFLENRCYLVFICVNEVEEIYERIGHFEPHGEHIIGPLSGLGEETVLTIV